MQPFVANTDRRWYDFLSAQSDQGRIDEVNFWQPRSTKPMKAMTAGEPVFFRLKRPDYCVAGYGFFAHFRVVSIEDAWGLFGWRNGADSFLTFVQRLAGYRSDDMSDPRNRRKSIGCTILREVRLWPDGRWLAWGAEQGWARNIVQGKTVRDPLLARTLMDMVRTDAVTPPPEFADEFTIVDDDTRVWAPTNRVHREGQGTFRARLLDAYGRCAITGERTEPVLDAAHIQPYRGPASNHIQNGLLLTKEFHELFDRGYVTVTPDYEVRVSGALREEWQNGKRYYAYDRKPLRTQPARQAWHPSRDALAWHGDNVFIS